MQQRRVLVAFLLMPALAAAVRGGTAMNASQAGSPDAAAWRLPSDAETLKNPHPVDDKLLATGRAVYKDQCARCHGPGGLGDGPDADPDARERMDLTEASRAEANPDGVVFHKVWNGRRRPRMPAFSTELSEDQVWAVVAYVQSIRRK